MTRPINDAILEAAGGNQELAASTLRRLARYQARAVKVCPADGAELPLSAFGPDTSKDDGLNRLCRAHAAEAARRNYHARTAPDRPFLSQPWPTPLLEGR